MLYIYRIANDTCKIIGFCAEAVENSQGKGFRVWYTLEITGVSEGAASAAAFCIPPDKVIYSTFNKAKKNFFAIMQIAFANKSSWPSSPKDILDDLAKYIEGKLNRKKR